MVKYLIIILLMVSVVAKAQKPLTAESVDIATYQLYLNGNWDQLIRMGNQALEQKIDFKYLRQRMGYAYFMKADYYASQYQYEKALAFDESDQDTRAYLYYCGMNTGDLANARFHAQKLPDKLQNDLKLKAFRPLDAIDLEYNYKLNNSSTRSDPTYMRLGLSTPLGYRFSLYQSVSYYKQTVDLALTEQPEYFALLNWSLNSHSTLSLAYHFLNTSSDGTKYPGNLIYGAFSKRISRYSFGLNGSFLSSDFGNTQQYGLTGSFVLPGKSTIYLNSALSGMIETGNNRIVFSQIAGAQVYKNLWAEGNITLGNLNNYNDHKALYVYNSVDPTTFRTGLSLFWYLGKKMTVFSNYTFDTKQNVTTSNNYKQHSFSGGIIWKL